MASQGERRSATRAALLDAAAACLVERGLAGFTTSEVIERSGRSTGALYSHFGAKSDLLEATVASILEQLRASFVSDLDAMADEQRTIPELLGLLWRQTSDPRLGAVWEIYTAARTDRSLQTAIEPVVRSHVKAIRRILLEEASDRVGIPNERVLQLANLAILALQGLAVNQLAAPDPGLVDMVLMDVADLVESAFNDHANASEDASTLLAVSSRPRP